MRKSNSGKCNEIFKCKYKGRSYKKGGFQKRSKHILNYGEDNDLMKQIIRHLQGMDNTCISGQSTRIIINPMDEETTVDNSEVAKNMRSEQNNAPKPGRVDDDDDDERI